MAEEKKKKGETEPNNQDYSQKFLDTRSVLVFGEVNKELAEKVVRQLLVLDQINNEPIRVFIDSPGGDIDAGFAIFDTMRYVDAPVYAIVMGLAASMGAMILLAAPKARRFGFEHSRYLIHQPLSGIRGVATDIEIHAKELEKYRIKINEIIAATTGQKIKQVALDTDRDFWLDAEEAIKYGLISKTVQKKSDIQ
ncbi:MAG: ATP-dependent Clp protease proteolytic subunit [Spirochaetia bacterium]